MTSTAFAAFQAPLPEFKNEKQLAEWRAEKASESTSQGYAAEETAFYTGKPYLASAGGYAFKYRSYNPKLVRWTSEDPSGFPDGANQLKYCPIPTTAIDFQGLLTLTGITGKPDDTKVTYDGIKYTISAKAAVFSPGADLPGTINISEYATWDFGDAGGVKFNADAVNVPSGGGDRSYHWKQSVTTNRKENGHASGTAFNDANLGSKYYSDDYPSTVPITNFKDTPHKSYTLATKGNPYVWSATVSYLGHNTSTNSDTVYGSITWGYTITE